MLPNPVSTSEWRDFLRAHPEAHLLQTAEWGELKSAFGWSVERLIAENAGAQVLFRRLPLGLTLAYIPRGPLGQAGPGFWTALDGLCRARRAVFVKVEPDRWDSHPAPAWPLDPSPHHIQPPRTVVVDLRPDEPVLLERMKQKTRYNIRLAEKKEVSVRPWADLEGFHRMIQITGGRDGFGVHSLDYYRRAYALFHPGGMCELLVAEYDGRPLAALMVFALGKRSWYLYGASNNEERNRMPTYLLQWEAMRWARARGCEEYDLWGVPDAPEAELEAGFESRSDGLWGVYRFKRGFGGQVLRAAPAMDRVYQRLLYRLYLLRVGRGGEAG